VGSRREILIPFWKEEKRQDRNYTRCKMKFYKESGISSRVYDTPSELGKEKVQCGRTSLWDDKSAARDRKGKSKRAVGKIPRNGWRKGF